MSIYGLELYDENGSRTLSITDRVGKFLGIFTVPAVPLRSNRTYKFEIPAHHLEAGELFFWYNPAYTPYFHWSDAHNKYYQPDVTMNITLSFNILTVNISVGTSHIGGGQFDSFQIFYGVH